MTSIFDLFQLIASNIWLYGGTFLLVLSILVFVHEWGHYIVARWCGVKVETFSIGFGKELFGWTDSKDTRWKVSLIPLGGYVKMFGDTDPASAGHSDGVEEGGKVRPFTKAEKAEAFYYKPVWKRAAVVFAGPAINFLFAIVLLFGLYTFYGQPVSSPIASAVIVGSAAEKAGIQPHDKIVAIDGEKITRFEDIRRIVAVALDTPLEFTLKRGEKEVTVTATPERKELKDRFGFAHSRGMLGIIGPSNGIAIENIASVSGRKTDDVDKTRKALLGKMNRKLEVGLKRGEEVDKLIINPIGDLNKGLKDPESEDYSILVVADHLGKEIIKHGPLDGMHASVTETWKITSSTLTALGQIFTGTRSAKELGGIIRIGAIAGDMAKSGILALIMFTALLSINLGLINLFPIPMLDGGHLVFYGLEAIKGKPIPEKFQEYAFRFGFVILIGIMFFANLNDIVQLIM